MRASGKIMACRTPLLGYHIASCPNDDYQTWRYNACKHRSCPQCGAAETELWLERRRRQALSCRYFHIIFTISHDLHPLWRCNRRAFTGRMLQAAWHSLRELLRDKKWLGVLPGAIGVFQSWDDDLNEHCHLHFIITAGGLTPAGKWADVNGDFLLPAPVLAALFRGKFLAYLKKGLGGLTPQDKTRPAAGRIVPPAGMSRRQCLNLFNKLGRKRWNVRIEPPYNHAHGVFKYLGRYVRRGPVSEKRIINYNGRTVRIAYAHPDKHDQPAFSLPADVFIDRLLRHVPANK